MDYENSFVNQAKAFTDFILFNKPPLSDLADAEDTLKIIYSAYKSAEKDLVLKI